MNIFPFSWWSNTLHADVTNITEQKQTLPVIPTRFSLQFLNKVMYLQSWSCEISDGSYSLGLRHSLSFAVYNRKILVTIIESFRDESNRVSRTEVVQRENFIRMEILHTSVALQYKLIGKSKGHAHNRPQGPKGVPGRLRPRIFLTFGTTTVVGRQPHAPAAFTPRWLPWYSFLEAESTPRAHGSVGSYGKIPQCDTTGNRSRDLPTSSAVNINLYKIIRIMNLRIWYYNIFLSQN
jgi:hypothetical protein